MIVKLASALNMSREDFKEELKNSMSGDFVCCLLLSHLTEVS